MPANVMLIIQLVVLIAQELPKLAPAAKAMLEDIRAMFQGTPMIDITEEEFEARIDKAIADLPDWK